MADRPHSAAALADIEAWFDTETCDHLPHLYGAVNWALVDDIKKLPLKVSDIYRRLAT